MIFDALPSKITAGDDVSFTVNPDGYPASSYRLEYGMLRDDGLKQITMIQTDILGQFARFVIAGSDSNAWEPGFYYFQLYAFDLETGARTSIQTGQLVVNPNLSQAQAPTQSQVTLQAISDLLEKKANDDIQTCSVNGKSLTAYSFTELLGLKTYYSGLVKQEINARRIAAGLQSKRTIRVAFPPVGGWRPFNAR